MAWTEELKLTYLMRLPWTIVAEKTPEGDSLLRVRELPSVVGCGTSPEELEKDFWESFESALRAYLHFGDLIPLPAEIELPWAQVEAGRKTLEDERRLAVSRKPTELPETIVQSTSRGAALPVRLEGEPIAV